MADDETPAEETERTYTDVETSYDTAFDRLVADAFPQSERGVLDLIGYGDAGIAEEAFDQGEEGLHGMLPENMGTYIETRLGNDLAALQERGGPEYDALVAHVAEIKPSSADELLDVYQRVASPETYTAIVLAQAGVSEADIETFTERLSDPDNATAREGLQTLITRLQEDPNMAGNMESMMERIEANGPLLRSMVANPDAFLAIANTDGFEPIINVIADHLADGGTLDQAGLGEMLADIPLADKAAIFMEIGGASAEDIEQFQTNLAAAVEANPELGNVINTALMNTIAASGEGVDAGAFETLRSSAEMFANYANSAYAQTLLSDPMMIDEIVTQAQARGDELTLDSLQDVAIESVAYEEFGRYAALNGSTMSPTALMFGGAGVNTAISMAQSMGDAESQARMQGILEGFEGILGRLGLGGFTGGLGNTPGWLAEAAPSVAARFGGELTADQQVFAALDQAYIFDGSDPDYPAIDYAAIGRNHADNVWRPDGSVRPEEERGPLAQTITGDAARTVMETEAGERIREGLDGLGDGLSAIIPR